MLALLFCAATRKAQEKKHTQSNPVGSVFPAASTMLSNVCNLHEGTSPPPVTGRTPPEQHPTYDTPAVIVTAPLPQRLQSRKVGDTKQTKRPSPITCRPSGLPPVTLLPRNAPAFPPAFRPYSCYCSAAALPPGFEPLVYPPPRTDTRRPFNLCHERRD